MKGYPRGWKPAKKKWRKAPTPPPGGDHGSMKDYDRERKREEDQELIINGLEDWENGKDHCDDV